MSSTPIARSRWFPRSLRKTPAPPIRRLGFEPLEARDVPAVINMAFQAVNATEGVSTSLTNPPTSPLATFSTNNYIGTDQSPQLSAEVLWGDGQVSGGLGTSGPPPGSVSIQFVNNVGTVANYQVFASHTYTAASLSGNPYVLTLRVYDGTDQGTITSTSSQLTVADQLLTATGLTQPTLVATSGSSLTDVVVARFIDRNPYSTADQLAAQVTWGNPSETVGGLIVPEGPASGGGVVYSVVSSHRFTSPGTPSVTTVVQGQANTVTVTNPNVSVAQGALVPSPVPVTVTEGATSIPDNTLLGTFTDQGGAQAVGNYSPSFASFPGASGPTSLKFTQVGTSNTFTVRTNGATGLSSPAKVGVSNYTLHIQDLSGNFGEAFGNYTVANAPITNVTGGVVSAPVEGQAVAYANLLQFTDANPGAAPGEYQVVIDWGDGSPQTTGSVTAIGGGTFQVGGTHTYTRRTGIVTQYKITVSVTDSGGQRVTGATNTFSVADAAITGGTPIPVVGAVGQELNEVPVATFTDANLYGLSTDLSATIDWGDGTTSPGDVTLVGRSAGTGSQFLVTGTHTYATAVPLLGGPQFTTKVTLTDVSNTAIPVIQGTATIAPSATPVTVYPQAAAAGTPLGFTAPLATFPNVAGVNDPTKYTVTVNWGDGTAPQTFAPGGTGVAYVLATNSFTFTPTGTHLYAKPGLYPVTVTVAGPTAGWSGTGSSTTVVSAPAFAAAPAAALTPTEGAPLPATTPVASFTVADPAAVAGGYTATIDWGDGSPQSAGTITLTGTTATTATFSVTGGHTYAHYNAGPLAVTVTVRDAYGNTAATQTTVTKVADAALGTPVGVAVVGQAGQQLVNVPLGTFVDANPLATAADHTVSISWGDGSPADTTGVVTLIGRSGGGTLFAVTGSHVYAATTGGAPKTVTAVVTDAGGSTTTITTSATITQTGIAVSVYSQNGSAGTPLTASNPLAVFEDANGNAAVGAYTATINWGDGTATDAGVISFDATSDRFSVAAPGPHTYARPGLFPVTVSVAGPNGRLGVGAASVVLVPAVLTASPAANITTAVEGAPLPGTTQVATFTVADPAAVASGFTATIDWGDGSPQTTGTVTATGPGAFSVTGGHTYAHYSAAPHTVTVTVRDAYGDASVATTTVTQVAEAGLSAPTGVAVVGAAGQQLSNVTVGTFVDANPLGTAADHAVTINWGDGSPLDTGLATLVGRSGTGLLFAVTGTHRYASTSAGTPYAVVATVTEPDGATTAVINTTATIVQTAIAVSVYPQAGSAGSLLVPTSPLAVFQDANGNGTAGQYTATVNWGDGTAPQTFAAGAGITFDAATDRFSFALPAAGHTYARPGVYPVTVSIAGPNGRLGIGASSAVLVPAVLTASPAASITTAVEGVALPGSTTVATFTVADPLAAASGFTATIDWGDGSPQTTGAVVATATPGLFRVTGGHTYTTYSAGGHTITVTVRDAYGDASVAQTAVTQVADAGLSGGTGVAVVGGAGLQLTNVTVGTFVDANPFGTAADHTATISWGDGSPAEAGLVTLVGRSGTGLLFAVSGTHTYANSTPSPYTINVTVTEPDGTTTTGFATTATITQTPLAVSVYSQNGPAAQPLVIVPPLAVFTDENGAGLATDYAATVNWGDGTIQVFAPGDGIAFQAAGNRFTFTPTGTGHVYAKPGVYPITVSITYGPDNRLGVAAATAVITPPPFVGGVVAGPDIAVNEGTAIPPTTTLATFTVADPTAVATGFIATIDWGDGSPFSTGTVTLTGTTATTASFKVTGGHTYTEAGTYTIIVRVADAFGGGGAATLTATVADAPLVNPQGITATGTVRQPLVNVTLGVFTDTNPFAPVSDFDAAIDWGDGTATTGPNAIGLVSPVGGNTTGATFAVAGNHVYAAAGTYTVTITVTDDDGQTTTITTSVNVLAVVLTGQANPVLATEGLPTPAGLPVASFASPGALDPAIYAVTVNWGDGQSNTTASGVTVQSTGGGNFVVHAPAHTYAEEGPYVVTVTITGTDGSGPLALTGLATVQDAPLTGALGAVTVNEGTPYVATAAAPLVTFTDANPAATTADFLATIDWGDGTSMIGTVVPFAGGGFGVLGTHTYPDSGSYTATAVVTDVGGQRAVIRAGITVANVAPTGSMTNPGPVNENSPVTVSVINVYDPSPADTAAGFRYSFATDPAQLAATYVAAGTLSSATFTFPDGPASPVVYGRVYDKDGGFADFQTTVTVNNVAPTATLTTAGANLPGQPVTVSLTNVFDPSPTDTAAGFTYRFDLGTGTYGPATTSPTATFTPKKAGTYAIRASVTDKDGGTTEYTLAGGLTIKDPTVFAVGTGNGGSPLVKVYSPVGNLVASFFAYDPNFRGGVNVAVGDVNGDGIPDVITGTGVGGGPHVKVFDGRDFSLMGQFMATNPDFRGGVHVAAADVDGDGKADVITGAGNGGGPQVQVFRGGDYAMIRNFFAYDPTVRGGVNVAAGDIDGDGKAEIVTGAGVGGAPHVKVFDGATGAEVRSFFAFESTQTGGVNVAVGDVDGDGRVEIVAAPGIGGGARLRTFDGQTLAPEQSVFAYGPDRVTGEPLRNGMTVAVVGEASVRGPLVVLGSGPDYSSLVSVRDGKTLDELATIIPFSDGGPDFNGGIYIG